MEEQLQLVIRRTSRTLAMGRSGCQVLWSKLLIQCFVKYFCLMNVWSDAMLTTFSHVTPINPKNQRDNFHLQCQRQPTYLMIHRESSHASQSTQEQDPAVLTTNQSQFSPSRTESPQPQVKRCSLRNRRSPEYLKEYDTEIRFSV